MMVHEEQKITYLHIYNVFVKVKKVNGGEQRICLIFVINQHTFLIGV